MVVNLNHLSDSISEMMDEDYCEVMKKCCVMMLSELNHIPGVAIDTFPDERNLYKELAVLFWNLSISKQMKTTFQDENRKTDHAAMWIALQLVPYLTGYKYVLPSALGTGIDFWLTNDEMGLKFEARLEISGIRLETPLNSIRRRLRMKIKQVEKSDKLENSAYIAIIEFSKPQLAIILK